MKLAGATKPQAVLRVMTSNLNIQKTLKIVQPLLTMCQKIITATAEQLIGRTDKKPGSVLLCSTKIPEANLRDVCREAAIAQFLLLV